MTMPLCKKAQMPVDTLYVSLEYIYHAGNNQLSLPEISDSLFAILDDKEKGTKMDCGDCSEFVDLIGLPNYFSSLASILREDLFSIWQSSKCHCNGEVLKIKVELVVCSEGDILVGDVEARCPFCGRVLSTDTIHKKLNQE